MSVVLLVMWLSHVGLRPARMFLKPLTPRCRVLEGGREEGWLLYEYGRTIRVADSSTITSTVGAVAATLPIMPKILQKTVNRTHQSPQNGCHA